MSFAPIWFLLICYPFAFFFDWYGSWGDFEGKKDNIPQVLTQKKEAIDQTRAILISELLAERIDMQSKTVHLQTQWLTQSTFFETKDGFKETCPIGEVNWKNCPIPRYGYPDLWITDPAYPMLKLTNVMNQLLRVLDRLSLEDPSTHIKELKCPADLRVETGIGKQEIGVGGFFRLSTCLLIVIDRKPNLKDGNNQLYIQNVRAYGTYCTYSNSSKGKKEMGNSRVFWIRLSARRNVEISIPNTQKLSPSPREGWPEFLRLSFLDHGCFLTLWTR